MIIKIQGNDTFSDRQCIRRNLIYNKYRTHKKIKKYDKCKKNII